jgi:hypothetical protein
MFTGFLIYREYGRQQLDGNEVLWEYSGRPALCMV